MTEPVPVAFTTVFADVWGGAERLLWWLLRDLDRDRVAPRLIAHADGEVVARARTAGIPALVTPTGRFRDLHRGLAAVRAIAAGLQGASAAVHWLHRAQVYGGPAARMAGIADRSVWWQHGLEAGAGGLDRVATALPARAVIACSESVAAEQRRIRPRRPVAAIPSAVPPPARASREELAALRDELGLDADGPPVVGIVGRLQRWKGQARLLDALWLLRREGLETRALIVGAGHEAIDPGYEDEVRAHARALGLDARFTGQVPDAAHHLQLCDVLVSAAEHEPFGMTVVEALALGVAVVAVDAGGPREVLDGGRWGVLAPSGAAPDLATAIGRVLRDHGLRERLAAGGPGRYADRYTLARFVGDTEAAVLALARGAAPQGAR